MIRRIKFHLVTFPLAFSFSCRRPPKVVQLMDKMTHADYGFLLEVAWQMLLMHWPQFAIQWLRRHFSMHDVCICLHLEDNLIFVSVFPHEIDILCYHLFQVVLSINLLGQRDVTFGQHIIIGMALLHSLALPISLPLVSADYRRALLKVFKRGQPTSTTYDGIGKKWRWFVLSNAWYVIW